MALPKLKMVPCKSKYWDFVRRLRMDSRVTVGFLETKRITKAAQDRYMKKNSKNYWICLVDDQPAGYIGVIAGDIRVCTHPKFQKTGVGLFMVKWLAQKRPSAVAKIKIQNKASQRLFTKAGFKPAFITFTLKTP